MQGTEIPILMQDAMIDLHLFLIIEKNIDLTGQDPICHHRYRSHSWSNSRRSHSW